MKIFGRKKTSKKSPRPHSATPGSEPDFYTRNTGEAPLNDFSAGHGQQTRRTSLNSPVRRRENSNRASRRQIFFLLFRTGLIIFLLAGGYIALKSVLGRLSGPTEEEKQQWEVDVERMERKDSEALRSAQPAPAEVRTPVSGAERIGERLRQWDEAEQHMRSAASMEQRGIAEEAVLRLKKVLRAAPDHRAAQQLLLDIYMQSENYEEAVSLCIRLLEQDSRQWGVKMDLLQVLQALGQTEDCLVLAEQMLKKEPNNLRVLEVTARAHRVAGNPDEALVLFGRILKNKSRHQAALAGCGSIYQELGEWDKAIPYYLELVRAHPGAQAYRDLVRCYARQAEAGKAVLCMGQAVSLYGEAEVSTWVLQDLEAFDLIRETVEYRSLADSLVGTKTRKAIEGIRKREAEKKLSPAPAGLDLPIQPELQLKPRSTP